MPMNVLQVISKTNSFEIPGNLEMFYLNAFKALRNFVTEQTMLLGCFFCFLFLREPWLNMSFLLMGGNWALVSK